tara:strand:- start:740 stop:1126 length:387 start_codon:yes stop_codon:yes gene_type:complete
MSLTENFEELLKNFFSLYHPRQVKKVGRIVQEFKGQEIMLLKVLCDRYKKAYTVIPGLNEELEELYADPQEEELIATDTAKDNVAEESDDEETTLTEETDINVQIEDGLEEEVEEEVVTETEEEEEEK